MRRLGTEEMWTVLREEALEEVMKRTDLVPAVVHRAYLTHRSLDFSLDIVAVHGDDDSTYTITMNVSDYEK